MKKNTIYLIILAIVVIGIGLTAILNRKEYNEEVLEPKLVTVNNELLGISFKYDSEEFTSVNNDKEEGGFSIPSVNLNSQNIDIDIHQAEFPLDQFFQITYMPGDSPLANMMYISRYDHEGFAGYKRWDWLVQNQSHASMVTYRFLRGDNYLEIVGWVDEEDPNSDLFKQSAEEIEKVVSSIEFIGSEKSGTESVSQEIDIKIDQGVICCD